jgi:NhaP-type Na+/H+ or K+/H+ antiporter
VGEQHPAIAPLRNSIRIREPVRVAVVIVVGALFAIVKVPLEAIAVAVALFVVIRPLSVLAALWGVPLEREQRALACWFGIRGVGSLCYVFYALTHGWEGAEAERVLGIVLGVVAISIFLHGISVTPLMSTYERHAGMVRRRKRPTVKTHRADRVRTALHGKSIAA